MSKNSLEEIKKYSAQLTKDIQGRKELNINSFMVEDVVEAAEQTMKWTDHKWEIDLSEDLKTVKRDGVDWGNVHFVGVKYDFDDITPKLIVESDFNGFDISMSEDGSQQIYYNGELLEEVQSYQIINDPKYDYITRIRFTLIADAEINWDYKVLRGERENPNIAFPKINYHNNSALTGSTLKQLEEEELNDNN